MDWKGGTNHADAGSRSVKAFPVIIWPRSKNLSCICRRRYILRKEGLAYEEDQYFQGVSKAQTLGSVFLQGTEDERGRLSQKGD